MPPPWHLTIATDIKCAGVPFHPDGRLPRAPCPLCTIEKNDRAEKDLLYINGICKGQYDPAIPEAYFKTPPTNLGGSSDPALDALLVIPLCLCSTFRC